MSKVAAGLLMFRRRGDALEVLLAHPGGPFWHGRDEGVWTLPKGEVDPGEDLLAAAIREFTEETGHAPTGPFAALSPVRLRSGKVVHAWAFEGDFDPATLVSNTCRIEWPPRSGKELEIPEIDRAAWFGLDEARRKLKPAQLPFIEELAR